MAKGRPAEEEDDSEGEELEHGNPETKKKKEKGQRKFTSDGDVEEAPDEVADAAAEELAKLGSDKDLNLEKIVSMPTWKEMLISLVNTEKIDPWNIDVVEIAEKYIERLKKIQLTDLRMPANLILAAAILLKFKSDALKFEEEEQVVVQEVYVDENMPPAEIPMLELRTRIPPKRKITLDELLQAMEKVFEEQKQREEKAVQTKLVQPILLVQLPEFNLEERMGEIFERVKKMADSEGLVLFSTLLKDDSAEEKIYTLLPLLFLNQHKKVSLRQDKIFGDIFVRLLADS